MDVNEDDIRKLITGQALLVDKVQTLTSIVKEITDDYESRLRVIEKGMGTMGTEISVIRERMTIFNLLQTTFTSIAALIVYFFKR